MTPPIPAQNPPCCTDPMKYAAPVWLPGGHAQTIWSALYAKKRSRTALPLQRTRWNAPDGDFVDVDHQNASCGSRPMLVLFHGLEGSSASHYAQAFADWSAEQDIHLAMPHFRGCSGQINLAPRAYHSGDHAEIDWVLKRLKQEHQQRGGSVLLAAGVSLGGNALMRWAAEHGHQASQSAQAIAAICSPLDLALSGAAIGKGLNRYLYTPMFLKSMKPKALAKWAQFPGLFDKKAMLNASDLYAFDNAFTLGESFGQAADARHPVARIGLECLQRSVCTGSELAAKVRCVEQCHLVATPTWRPRGVRFRSMAWACVAHARGRGPLAHGSSRTAYRRHKAARGLKNG